MADRSERYQSAFTGADIDEAVRRVMEKDMGVVNSFNGRTGAVFPQAGDYTPGLVGAYPAADVEFLTDAEIDAIVQGEPEETPGS